MFARSSVLVAAHGAPHANSIFMPAGAVVVEVLNCGHYTDVSRKLITETGHSHAARASACCRAAPHAPLCFDVYMCPHRPLFDMYLNETVVP